MAATVLDVHTGDSPFNKMEAPSSHLLNGLNGESLLTTRQESIVNSSSAPSLPAMEVVSPEAKPSFFSDIKAALPDLWNGAKDEVENHPWQIAKSFGEGVAEGAIATAAVVGLAAISAPLAIGAVGIAGAVGVYEAGSAVTKWISAGSTLENSNATAAQTQAAHDTLLSGGHAVVDTTANVIGGITGAGAASFGINALTAAVARGAVGAETPIPMESTAPVAQAPVGGAPVGVESAPIPQTTVGSTPTGLESAPAPQAPVGANNNSGLSFSDTVQAQTTEHFPNATGADRSFAEFLTAQAAGDGSTNTAWWATENLSDPEQIGQFVELYAKNSPAAIANIAMRVGDGTVDGTDSAWNIALSHASATIGDQSGAAWYAALAKRG